MSNIISDKGGKGTKAPSQTSAMASSMAGSGSRPTKSSYPIDTTAPTEPRELGRAPSGWLK